MGCYLKQQQERMDQCHIRTVMENLIWGFEWMMLLAHFESRQRSVMVDSSELVSMKLD